MIGGSAGGIRLEGPRGGATRPLAGRVKESLFAALEADGALDGPFLDLYAGTGAGGIEALSRGAPSATFVEHDRRTCALISANLERTRLEHAAIVRADTIAFLRSGRPNDVPPYRACLVDPPYEQALLPALELLGSARPAWLLDGGVVVAKHFWRSTTPANVGDLRRTRQKRFGETVLSFYTRGEGVGEAQVSPK